MGKSRTPGGFGHNPPKSKEAKENWERCNIKGSKAGKITKVIDMSKIKGIKKMSKPFYITKPKNDYNFERVDIFLRVKDRLPDKEGDELTQEILDEYCERFEKGKLTKGIVPLEHMYNLIKHGKIKSTKSIKKLINQNKYYGRNKKI